MPEGFLAVVGVKPRPSGWAGGSGFWFSGVPLGVWKEKPCRMEGAAMGRAVWCGFAMLESCGKGGFAADEVLRGWSEGDGAVGGLGLRQKGLAAL